MFSGNEEPTLSTAVHEAMSAVKNARAGNDFWRIFDSVHPGSTLDGYLTTWRPAKDGAIRMRGPNATDRTIESHHIDRIAVGRRGTYILIADWPLYHVYVSEDDVIDGDVEVSAAFVPADATSREHVVSLLDFRLSRSQVGRDLLVSLMRESPQSDEINAVLLDLLHENVELARQTIIRHDSDHGLDILPGPYLRVPEKLKRTVATWPYPEKQCLRTGSEREDWIAVIPGRGILRQMGEPQSIADLLGEDGSYEAYTGELPGWVDETTLFRPSDERRDPGLAERFRAAAERSRMEGPLPEDASLAF